MAQEDWKRDKDELGLQKPEGPIPCKNNCGFFGSLTTSNMCSKCYRDTVLKQAKTNSTKVEEENSQVPTKQSELKSVSNFGLPDSAPSPHSGSDKSASVAEVESKGTAPVLLNRCFTCNKRVGLTGFTCRCSHVFCPVHRYSDKHNCTFDYKSTGRAAIQRANPIVKGQKVDRI